MRDAELTRARLAFDSRPCGGMPSASDFAYVMEREPVVLEALRSCGPMLLDVGCGDGFNLLRLKSLGFRVTGIDLSPKRVALAKGRTNGHACVGSADALPWGDDSFDVATAYTLLSSILDASVRRKAAEEMRRVAPVCVVYDIRGLGDHGDSHWLSADEMRQLFPGCELTALKAHWVGVWRA